jgi:hypothetical protein
MSTTNAPFGFRPAYHPSGTIRPRKYRIAGSEGTSYATDIFCNNPVMLEGTAGTITVAAAGSGDILGVFMGCEYIDATGRPVVSNYWPASTAATNVVAWVVDNPLTIFEVQNVGSVTLANLGEEAFTTAHSGSTSTGLATTTLAAPNGTTQSHWRIVGFGQQIDNAPGDTYTIVQVQLAMSQLAANKVGV